MKKIKVGVLIFLVVALGAGCLLTLRAGEKEEQKAAKVQKETIIRYLEESTLTPNFGGKVFADYYEFGRRENQIFIWGYVSEYYQEGEQIKQGTAFSMPIALEVFNGEIISHKSPRDGSYYAKDIKKIFPKKLEGDALNFHTRHKEELNEIARATETKAKTYFEKLEPQTQKFKNDYLEVEIPKSWSYKETAEGALNIRKNNYIIFINPNTTQASGAPGGRFSEIAQGAPGTKLVMKKHPGPPCGESETEKITEKLEITHFYIDSNEEETTMCNVPSSNEPLWYFSYVTTIGDGYFGDASKFNSNFEELRQFVITVSYKTDNIEDLPQKKSVEHEKTMEEIISLIKTIELR